MSDSNREIEELESRLWRYFSNHNYGVGDRTFQRIIELDPERASALVAKYQKIQAEYQDEINRFGGRMSREQLDDDRNSIDAAGIIIDELLRHGATPPDS